MDDTSGRLLLFLFVFWTGVAILSSYFGVEITKNRLEGLTSDSTYEETTVVQILSDIPIIKEIIPLMDILTFKYEDPGIKNIGYILHFLIVITTISFVAWVRG